MGTEKREVEFSKEIDDVMVLFVELASTIKEGGEYTELFDELVEAINGAADIDDEVVEDLGVAMQTMGYRLGQLIRVFLKK